MEERKCLSAAVLMIDCTNEENSRDSSNALIALTRAKVPFLTASSEGEEYGGLFLVGDDERIFRGLEGVQSYIDEYRTGRAKKAG